MIRIRGEQMRALRLGTYLSRVEKDCCARLRERSIPELHALVERSLRVARAHGFADDELLVRYLRLVVRLGDDLTSEETASWAVPILSDPVHEPADLMDELEAWTERALEERAT